MHCILSSSRLPLLELCALPSLRERLEDSREERIGVQLWVNEQSSGERSPGARVACPAYP